MVVVPARASWDGGAAEVDRPTNRIARLDRERDLHHLGRLQLERIVDLGCQRGDGYIRVPPERSQCRSHGDRIDRRQIALQHYDDVVGSIRIDHPERGVCAVRASRQCRVGQHRAAAEVLDRIGNRLVTAGDDDGADIGLDAAPPDMRDHRTAIDVGQRLAG
jgi:hypothetical protein